MVRIRAVVVWLLVTGLVAGAPAALGPELEPAAGSLAAMGLARSLRAVAAVVLAGCVLWWWVVSTVVLAAAVQGRLRRPAGCPRWLHRLVLGGLGLAVAGALAPPSLADPGGLRLPPSGPADELPAAIHGLPLPDRPTGTVAPPARGRTVPGPRRAEARPIAAGPHHPRPPVLPPRTDRWVVRPGDTLWAIAAHALPDGASPALIDDRWRAVYLLNRAVVGADPDLLSPGTVLRLPPRREEPR